MCADACVQLKHARDCWNPVVKTAPSDRQRKRDLQQYGHKRWLEESWRDDMHLSGMSHEDLHKRWFGEDVVAWIKSLWEVAKEPRYTHLVKDEFPVTLYRHEMGPCMAGGVEVYSSLNIKANTKVDIETIFGMTIIAKLGTPIDFSSPYVYFRNKGEVTSVFTVDALTTARFSPGGVEFDDKWDGSSCTIDLTLDGWIRVYASGQVDNADS
ncbi:hypothetical protein M436DRAFT_81438 [Aureobasidium namibiae CBS 147.97]|uniref:Uncharacterized protein n=1 Tax=Aureobasidium namibiae CBS 147.97 TaxID=1043004 RepID=A0A074XHH7_9PEZI